MVFLIRFLGSQKLSPMANQTGVPVWRITLPSLARLDVVNDPGLWKRKFLPYGLDKLLPVHLALVAPPAQPVSPSMLGMLEDDFKPLEVATYPIVLVVATQFRTECPVLLSQWFMAILTTPYPYPFHKPTQSFPDCLALDDPVPTACFGPIVGKSEKVECPLAFRRIIST